MPPYGMVEAISKKSFRPISALNPRIKSSTYLRVDPRSRLPSLPEGDAGQVISAENPNFEMVSNKCFLLTIKGLYIII